jgi:aspartyl-tRNA(Asn)/glutamyl-tRNA(Gln) amidotransferase subunit A
MSGDFDYMSATSLRKLIVGKQISPVELVERALSNAASTQADLNSFFVIDAEGARATARRAETAIVQGAPLGLLHGLPVSVKDLIAVGGLPYASGSRANGQHRTRRRSGSGETESSWRHHHRKNNDERIRLQTGRR